MAALPIAADGMPGPAAVSPGPTFPSAVALTPDGTHLYASSPGTAEILAFDVDASGALTPRTGITFSEPMIDPDPEQIAISPDGTHAYVADPGPEGVRVLSIAADGSLTQVEVAPMPGADFTTGVAITPDGKQVFASAANPPARIYGFNVTATGSLEPQTPAFVAAVPAVEALSVRPNGHTLYAASASTGGIQAFALEEGTLLELKGSPFATGIAHNGIVASPQGGNLYATRDDSPGSLESFAIGDLGELTPLGVPVPAVDATTDAIGVTPDGSHVYSAGRISEANLAANVSPFAVNAGLLSLASPTPVAAGVKLPVFDSMAISPDQPPRASFTAAQQGQTNEVRFDAGASTDPDGTIARYDWSFGDGSTLANGGPSPSHTYPRPGTYTATVTLTDDEGCSTAFVATGQTASCNGSAVARAERQVVVAREEGKKSGGGGSAGGKAKPKRPKKPKQPANGRPVLLLSGPKRQPLAHKVKLGAACNEACRVTVRSKLVLRTPAGSHTVKVRRLSRQLPAGRRTVLKLRLSTQALATATATLATRGGKARLAVSATAVDASGQRSARALRGIRLLP
ncbi:MAG TPA: PKD domain-containing protein [Solirubrobacterales bacterium]|nr:PKD domain-containing protein [Solirubrobacterales bacterium]